MSFTHFCTFFIFVFTSGVRAAPPLGSYGADPTGVTVSGVSSGAAFAVQMHVAHSSSIQGAASFAGVPYYCAKGNAYYALFQCLSGTWQIYVNGLIQTTNYYDFLNKVDNTDNLQNSSVYVYHGTNDDIVEIGASQKSIQYYQHYGANVLSKLDIAAGHGIPTDGYGGSCSSSDYPFLNNCGYYGAFEALSHIYGGLQRPTASYTPTGQFLEYDQDEFDTSLYKLHFDGDGGYLYVPTNCAVSGSNCKLHVVFHGCGMGRAIMGDEFAKNAGYLEVADFNDVIILFPQIKASIIGGNENGCWDWWGYDGIYTYATKQGTQISTIKAMIDRVTA